MKAFNKYIILPLMGSLLVLTSCNDFLDREPLDEVTPDKYLWSDSELASYAVKHYSFNTHGGWNIGTWGEDNHTDNQATANAANRWIPGQWKVAETIKHSDDPWNFDAIREANYFLGVVIPRYESGQIKGDQKKAGHYIGEVYFQRAWQYFNKLQTFGDFPISKTTLPDEIGALTEASKRMPRNEVARFIIEDLDKAIALLTNNPDGGKNRITKNVALLVKSRVALYEASWLTYHKGTNRVPGGPGWPGTATGINIDAEISYFIAECKKAAAEVADNIKLADNNGLKVGNPYFAQFSDLSLEKYPEILMWRAYNLVDFGIRHSATFYIRTGGNTGFTRQFVETFLCTNGKPIYASPDLYKGDKSILDVKKNRESRLQLFMMTPGEVLSNITTLKDTLALAPNIIAKEETRPVTGYMLRKGLSDNWYRDGDTSIEGCPIFRAAEAYLNYMEASCIENGGNSIDNKAATYWKAIRDRAQLPDYQITIDATELSKESDWAVYSGGVQVSKLLYCIRRERRCELMEEGFRMNDLKRWRALDQLKNYQIEGVNLWGSNLKNMYPVLGANGQPTGASRLIPEGMPNANVSNPQNSDYLRPYQIVKSGNLAYDGYNWCDAHYLNPISMQHFRITATNPDDGSTSVIYQNPGWPLQSNAGAIGYK